MKIKRPKDLNEKNFRVKIYSYVLGIRPFIGLLRVEGARGKGEVEFTKKDARKIAMRLLRFADWADSMGAE